MTQGSAVECWQKPGGENLPARPGESAYVRAAGVKLGAASSREQKCDGSVDMPAKPRDASTCKC